MSGLTFTAIIDQRRFTGNARSTVSTASDLAPLIRLVFSRTGEPSAGYSPAYSFNDPAGMCPHCEGLGTVVDIDVEELIDPQKTINEGPVRFSQFRPGGACTPATWSGLMCPSPISWTPARHWSSSSTICGSSPRPTT